MEFNQMDISNEVKKAVEILGFKNPTEIQEKAIPIVLTGVDFIGQAQTGTGKTLSYAIPIVEGIDFNNQNIQSLVLCPTRELALQVYAEFVKLVRFSKKVRVITIYGGQSIQRQISDLRNKPQIVIGTPGRIIDHMNRKTLKFHDLKMLVLDEADEMLKMGFQEDIEYILKTTPKERQSLLFSATMPQQIVNVSKKYLNNPTRVKIEAKALTVDSIEQNYYEVKESSKKDLLIRLLDYYGFKSAIVFCNTKRMVDALVAQLQGHDYSVDGLHGDLKQMQRDRVMGAFRKGNIKVLIATDVAARGIDVKGVEVVFNFDFPLDDESYVHRIGRTGRAGLKGVSISFVSRKSRMRLSQIERYTKSNISKKEIPSIEDVKNSSSRNLYDEIVETLNSTEPRKHSHIINKLLAEGYDGIDIINSLIDINVKDVIKDYKQIEVDFPSKKRTPATSSKGKYEIYEINIGKNNGVTPPNLLAMIGKTTKIPTSSIGEIKIMKSRTVFEVKKTFANNIGKIDGRKQQGVNLKVNKVFSLR